MAHGALFEKAGQRYESVTVSRSDDTLPNKQTNSGAAPRLLADSFHQPDTVIKKSPLVGNELDYLHSQSIQVVMEGNFY